MTAPCPECGAAVTVDGGAVVGEVVPCPDCAADLEVNALLPLALVLAPPEEEDWGE